VVATIATTASSTASPTARNASTISTAHVWSLCLYHAFDLLNKFTQAHGYLYVVASSQAVMFKVHSKLSYSP